MSELLPDGIDNLRDCPHILFGAIRRALVFLSFEEWPEDERPERRIWLDDEKLEQHFKAVKKAHKDRASGKPQIDDPVENAAARLLLSPE